MFLFKTVNTLMLFLLLGACTSEMPESLGQNKIAYAFGGSIYVMNGDGSNEQRYFSPTVGNPKKNQKWATLKNKYYQPHLAPDNKTLVCVRSNNDSGGFVGNMGELSRLQSFDLILTNIDNRISELLKSTSAEQPIASPRFSPNQKQMACLLNGDLLIINLENKGEKIVELPKETKRYPYPAAAPTNFMIAPYIRWSKSGRWICVFNRSALAVIVDTEQNHQFVYKEDLPDSFWQENLIVKRALKEDFIKKNLSVDQWRNPPKEFYKQHKWLTNVKFVYPEISDDQRFVYVRRKKEGFMAKYWFEIYDTKTSKYLYLKTLKRFLYIE